MKKFSVILRNIVIATLLLSFMFSAVGAVAQYDPAQEGILSSYYQIDQGMIRGIAPGTTAEKLNKVKPLSIGQAAGISGVNPADIAVLIIRTEGENK